MIEMFKEGDLQFDHLYRSSTWKILLGQHRPMNFSARIPSLNLANSRQASRMWDSTQSAEPQMECLLRISERTPDRSPQCFAD